MTEPLLALRDMAGARGGRMLFDRLTLELAPGDAALVTGPNGAGKSTLIRIAAGLLAPAAGDVTARGGIALLAEAAALDPELTVAASLGFWAKLDGIGDPVTQITAALADLALDHLAHVPVRFLSTGQRRRVAFARVLASGAPVWLLDEPANGLDDAAVARLAALVARHRRANGIALVATHLPLDLPGAMSIRLAAPVSAA